ncbi:hypothetical protein A1D24_03110 [Testudinibacter aquarius]|uniref:Uncharacterized protein n=1 Tax=Testudinibacter aquarius TaxID=1524974 RepID=A0A4R3Y5Z9_9PAST|nr:hypothetical protein A1D24_03110 [Testudinibacter aquarius]TCV87226.1 hypothetical protein EDC16_105145 [Testudinibacter aquarius]TNG91269.1 hypothetical protein FHQ21_08190 [Testudinibacter aquarius]
MARKFIETELGIEIQCSCCKEFYPADTEFFYKQPGYQRSKWGYILGVRRAMKLTLHKKLSGSGGKQKCVKVRLSSQQIV